MKHCYKLIIVPAALLALAACVKEETGENTLPESANVVSFVLGGDNVVTKSADGAPAASYAIEGVEKAEGLHVVLEITAQSVRFIEEGEDASAKKADAITLWGTAISDQLDIQPE